jgi:rhamnogalacturonyl hydrolase YesR
LCYFNTPFRRANASRADFVYMAPPFIANFGALQNDSGGLAIMQIAYDQIRLYRQALFDQNASLWRHIAYGSSEDIGHWGTGA